MMTDLSLESIAYREREKLHLVYEISSRCSWQLPRKVSNIYQQSTALTESNTEKALAQREIEKVLFIPQKSGLNSRIESQGSKSHRTYE